MSLPPRIDELSLALQPPASGGSGGGAAPESVSALLATPVDPLAGFVFAHGAGAGMTHPFMERLALALAERRVATLRSQFPFMQRGAKRPDPPPLAHAAVRAAVEEARRRLPALPWLAGGKSFGGRMTSQAQALAPLPGVTGLVFVGFPLHPAGRPGNERAEHLQRVRLPMLFLQGTRDELAELALIEGVCTRLAPRATLEVFDDADHAFHVRRASGSNDAAVLARLADRIAQWAVSIAR